MKLRKSMVLIRYRIWREWWISELKSRENKLFDYQTGKPMSIEKRLHHERPKIDDIARFITKDQDLDLSIRSTDKGYLARIEGDGVTIQKFAPTIYAVMFLAISDYLKSIHINAPPGAA